MQRREEGILACDATDAKAVVLVVEVLRVQLVTAEVQVVRAVII